MGFTHLHVHSDYSFLDGASNLDALLAQCARLEMPTLAVTDHDNLCLAVRFLKAAKAADLKPILGAEITLTGGHHLTLLAQNRTGYANLCQLLTHAHLTNERGKPQTSKSALAAHHDGLIALSGCWRGEVPSRILRREFARAKEAAEWYREAFGRDSFYLELQHTYRPGDCRLNRYLSQLAEAIGVQTVATNNVHYATKPEFKVQDILTCIRTLTKLDEPHAERKINGELYLKSPAEMAELFAQYQQALANTTEIADRCERYELRGEGYIPEYPLPVGETAAGYLRKLTYLGAKARYGKVTDRIRERLDYELRIVDQLGFSNYFLVVWDAAHFARRKGIRYAGRGSAADSAVAYCLYITMVDAFTRNLRFERFINPARAHALPDIDLDFDARYRDDVTEYVVQKYGKEHVATVCTFNCYHARSAIRDVGKALNFPNAEIDRFAKLMPWIEANQIRDALPKYPELRDSRIPERKFHLLLDLCHAIAEHPRHLGTHLGGIVISRVPLSHLSPLQTAAKGVTIIQFDKDDVEELRLIKLDLLCLRMLGAVEDSVKSINSGQQSAVSDQRPANRQSAICNLQSAILLTQLPDHPVASKPFSYDAIPLADRPTYDLLNTGETVGIFQLESPAQRALQSRLKADNIEDIVASVALIRPGPIQGNMVDPFLARRKGAEPISYLHPELESILEKTYGVVLFQEQVIEIAIKIAGFTPGEADDLRRVMTHHRSHRQMKEIGENFIRKAVARGIPKEVADTVFSYIQGYAGYGFCEAHAAAFGDTAYKTAYLLRHHPAHFYAALLSNQPMGFYSPHTIINEARLCGIAVLPPDVNRSEKAFTVISDLRFGISDLGDPPPATRHPSSAPQLPSYPVTQSPQQAIRVGLAQVRGMSDAALDRLLAAREERPFVSLTDFAARARLPRDLTENFILCGAFDALDPNRKKLLWELADVQPEKNDGEARLDLETTPQSWLPELEDFNDVQRFCYEWDLLGFSPHKHPMEFCRERMKLLGVKTAAEIKRTPAGKSVRAAGVLIRPHRPPTRSGRTVVFFSLEDETGLLDITVFENIYQQFGKLIFSESALLVDGRLTNRDGSLSVTAQKISRFPVNTVANLKSYLRPPGCGHPPSQ
jgi:error-prone DNA polymerase